MKTVWYISKYVKTSFVGNSGSRGYYLLEELSKIGFKSYIFSSFPFKNSINFEKPIININKNFEYVYLNSYKFKFSNSFKRILSWINFEMKLLLLNKRNLSKPDLIIVSSLSLLTILNGLLLKRKYRCKLIFEVRDIWPLTLTEEGGFNKYNIFILLLQFIEFLGYKYSDHIIGTMPNLKEHVKNILGYYKEVTCIPIGYKKEELHTSKKIPNSINILFPKNKFTIGYFGGMGISNALDPFFNVVCKCKNNHDIHFLVAGSGDLKKKYTMQTRNLENITILPLVDKKFINSIFERCDLLYFSTHDSKIWEYGQSLNKLVEYMLSGKPIIGSYNGYETMINEASCGEFLKPYDEEAIIESILRYKNMDNEERKVIGLRGKQWILKHRSYEQLAENLAGLISSLT